MDPTYVERGQIQRQTVGRRLPRVRGRGVVHEHGFGAARRKRSGGGFPDSADVLNP